MLKNPFVLIVVIALIILVGVGGLFYFKNSKTSETMMKNEDTMMKDENMGADEKMMKKDDSAMMENSRYVDYSKEVFESSSKNKRVLFFYANWCPTCRPTDENFKQNSLKLPEDVTLIRVNYNDSDTDQEEKDLAKKYNVTYQHTFVQIDENGKEITKWNGGQIEELLAKIK